MTRTQQRGRDRRDQLLDCAEALFFRKGYEAASIQDLMEAAGVSKGAVYHHFKSKEEVLEALSVRLAEAAAESVTGLVSDASLGAIEKLNLVLEALRARKAAEWPNIEGSYDSLFSPSGVALFHQLNQAMSRVMTPLFATILQTGIEEGCFRITDAATVAEMILHLEGAVHPALSRAADCPGGIAGDEGAAIIQGRLGQIGLAVDRLLGLPDYTVVFADPLHDGELSPRL